MTIMRLAALLLLSLMLAACASSRSGDVYTRGQTRQEMLVRTGTVESVREVLMEGTESGVVTVAGAAVGGIAGSNIGGGRGQAARPGRKGGQPTGVEPCGATDGACLRLEAGLGVVEMRREDYLRLLTQATQTPPSPGLATPGPLPAVMPLAERHATPSR